MKIKLTLLGLVCTICFENILQAQIFIKEATVSILNEHSGFEKIAPYINNAELIFDGYVALKEKYIVHYREALTNKQLDLILRQSKSEQENFYALSIKATDGNTWLVTDTFKLLIGNIKSLSTGLYSKLYAPVYAWCKPVLFNDINEIDTTAGIQISYCRFEDKKYGLIMPLGGNAFSFSLGKCTNGFGAVGNLSIAKSISGEIPVMAIGISSNIYKLVTTSFKKAFKLMGISKNLRINKVKPTMFNYLGWASWNAYSHSLNDKKILASAEDFKQNKIPVKWFLLDDGWLDVSNNKLNSFNPDNVKFPNGFSMLTKKLKQRYEIPFTGVWHTMNGYWEGLSEKGTLAKDYKQLLSYKDRIVWLSDSVQQFKFINPFSNDGSKFYDNWYGTLKKQGISFVKVDNQRVVKHLSTSNFVQWDASERIFKNLCHANNKYFAGRIIHCMNMSNTNFYHYKNTAVCRVVEDFNPAGDSTLYDFTFNGNAASHVLASVHNSFWLSNISWPDFDMFQSNRNDAWYYAIAKIMSAGPVYITDEPSKHNTALLKSIATSAGKLINAAVPALPVEDCIFQLFDAPKPLMVFSNFGKTGLLAAWNVSNKETVKGFFRSDELNSFNSKQFVLFEFFSKSITKSTQSDSTAIELNKGGVKLYNLIPLQFDKAIIGDTSKVIPGVILSNFLITKNQVVTKVTQNCNLLVYSKKKPVKVVVNNVAIKNSAIHFSNHLLSIRDLKIKSKVVVTYL